MTNRQCILCGCWHNARVIATQIEEIIEELQLCRHCFEPYKAQIIIDELPGSIQSKRRASLLNKSLDDKDEGKR